mmetsp:Transcript_15776/g.35074  ORF Transcript_15776/g.35074 Transcript_15776/m.35074 type:complete len:347 (-) Transcript_15776:23-1063(-)
MWAALVSSGLAEKCQRLAAAPVEEAVLQRVHSAEHVQAVLSLRGRGQEELDAWAQERDSMYLNPASVEAALVACGGVVEATAAVLEGRLQRVACLVRPPGHHVEPEKAMGFGLFSNVAVGARHAQSLGAKRVLIVDFDVHHGNGTQKAFYDDDSVLFVSLHRHDNGSFYPLEADAGADFVGSGSGVGRNINVPWAVRGKGIRNPPPGDADFAHAFSEIVIPAAKEFAPDIVFISAGFDSAFGDSMGGCQLTPTGYHHMVAALAALGTGRVVLALEGGYAITVACECMQACVLALLGEDMAPEEAEEDLMGLGPGAPLSGPPAPCHSAVVAEVRRRLQEYWLCLSGE